MFGIVAMEQVIYCLIGIAVLLIILKIISVPMKIIKRLLVNSIIGVVILYMLSFFGIKLAISWWGYAIIGLFGVPGLIFVAILSFIL